MVISRYVSSHSDSESFVELTFGTAAALAGVIPADPDQAYSMNACGGGHGFDADAQVPLREL